MGSAPGGLQFPWGGAVPAKYIDKVEAAAQQGNSTVFITGVDPGFVTDLVPFALAGTDNDWGEISGGLSISLGARAEFAVEADSTICCALLD